MLAYVQLPFIALSFMGLCGFLRAQWNIRSTDAPLISACGVIVIMMLGGMARCLYWTRIALYAAGASGLVYAYGIKRIRADRFVLILSAVMLFGGAALFFRCGFEGWDDYTHWGLIVKYLFRNRSLPDASSEIIYFQSYAPGSALFIYYLCGFQTDIVEGMTLAAQCFLGFLGMLPLMGHIEQNKLYGYTIIALSYVIILTITNFASLMVEPLLALMMIGAMSILVRDRYYTGMMLPLFCGSLFLIKTSGVYCGCVLVFMAWYTHKNGRKKTVLAGIIAIAAAFLLWKLHLKLSYKANVNDKFALSISAFISKLSVKLKDGLWFQILLRMGKRVFLPGKRNTLLLLIAVTVFGVCCMLVRTLEQDKRRPLFLLLNKALVFCVITYAIWYALIYAMYVFSMPPREAGVLASLERYEITGIGCVWGMVLIILLKFVCGGNAILPSRGAARAMALMIIPVLLLGAAVYTFQDDIRKAPFLSRVPYRENYEPIACAGEAFPEYTNGDASILLLDEQQKRAKTLSVCMVKYKFFTNDIKAIIYDPQEDGMSYSYLSETHPNGAVSGRAENLQETLETLMEGCDCILVLEKNDNFEAALEACNPEIPVIYAYKLKGQA